MTTLHSIFGESFIWRSWAYRYSETLDLSHRMSQMFQPWIQGPRISIGYVLWLDKWITDVWLHFAQLLGSTITSTYLRCDWLKPLYKELLSQWLAGAGQKQAGHSHWDTIVTGIKKWIDLSIVLGMVCWVQNRPDAELTYKVTARQHALLMTMDPGSWMCCWKKVGPAATSGDHCDRA